jgi:site-specific DNA-methyltransferase (adenine-specific)
MNYELKLGDTLERMREIPDGSIDMILCDLPYGTTACKWDTVIPFEPLWEAYRRVTKKNAAIVLTASQPFTSVLIASNLKAFKYCWTWDKVNRVSGHLNAKKQPMRIVEDVVVLYLEQPTYLPQMVKGEPYTAKSKGAKSSCYGAQTDGVTTINDGNYYPRNLISIPADERGTVGRIHPTQKPVALMEYLIHTYTNPGELVLDNTMGSGTTGVACVNTDRRFIGIERDEKYFAIAEERILNAYLEGFEP